MLSAGKAEPFREAGGGAEASPANLDSSEIS